jgi:hypothetical protein
MAAPAAALPTPLPTHTLFTAPSPPLIQFWLPFKFSQFARYLLDYGRGMALDLLFNVFTFKTAFKALDHDLHLV